ncbi:MAG: VOC family protein [Acidimicrobiales bacterium]|nr:MAG: VOC family protein [Acidimicrobiales bacterium]
MSVTEQPATSPYGDTGAKPAPDLHPNGVNHLAISTADMKAQLTFFAEVLGCPTRALYWMHGVADTLHGFAELAGESYIAFVQAPGNPTEPVWGVTHSGNAGEPVTAGTMQHVAFNVDSIDDVLTMRDRIRSHGIQVFGPLDHGMIQSIYFAGPEGLSLEVCTGRDIDAHQWVDPEVQGLCGISAEELARLTDPAGFERPDEPVPQPPYDESLPNMRYPEPVREFLMGMPDADVWTRLSESTPPVSLD